VATGAGAAGLLALALTATDACDRWLRGCASGACCWDCRATAATWLAAATESAATWTAAAAVAAAASRSAPLPARATTRVDARLYIVLRTPQAGAKPAREEVDICRTRAVIAVKEAGPLTPGKH
jgi:hypothetical protein